MKKNFLILAMTLLLFNGMKAQDNKNYIPCEIICEFDHFGESRYDSVFIVKAIIKNRHLRGCNELIFTKNANQEVNMSNLSLENNSDVNKRLFNHEIVLGKTGEVPSNIELYALIDGDSVRIKMPNPKTKKLSKDQIEQRDMPARFKK